MTAVLLVFAKYPETGKCKTRLIPHLGAKTAAELHRSMTAHTLQWARELTRTSSVELEVHFSGGDVAAMQSSFGNDLLYVPQVDGNLGLRLQSAFQRQIARGVERIVVVGTDCPQLTAQLVANAFDRLTKHSACLAPARDGGYVLLGLSNASGHPQASMEYLADRVFKHVDWGSQQVLQQTLEQLFSTRATLTLLPRFSDVDLPADLPVWELVQSGEPAVQPRVSVIIPTLNGEPLLAEAIESALAAPQAECIVAAAGDFQQSIQVAAERAAQVVVTKPGRGHQMNQAAEAAVGDVLIFLHGDTLLPPNYVKHIDDCLSQPSIAAGAFSLKINSPAWQAGCIQWGVGLRSRYLQSPYGDQAIFLRRSVFEKEGGFRELPIMEDYELIRRLRRRGRIAICNECVMTSGRRWNKMGFFKTTLKNQWMLAAYHLGVPLEQLAKQYRG